MLDWGGNCVIIGVPAADAEFSALFTLLHPGRPGVARLPLRLGSPHRDIPLLIELYQPGRIMLDELVSATYPLEQFDTVVADLRRQARPRRHQF